MMVIIVTCLIPSPRASCALFPNSYSRARSARRACGGGTQHCSYPVTGTAKSLSPNTSHSSFIRNELYSCCVLFSESRSAEQTHPESGAEHHDGTERSQLVIFTTCPITSRQQHRASAERCRSSLHFTSVTFHLFLLAQVVSFHLTVTQYFSQK